MNTEQITIEQSAAQQIGETLATWLPDKIRTAFDAGDTEVKFTASIKVKDKKGIAGVEIRLRELIPSEPVEIEFDVDPMQQKLPLNQED